MVFLRPADIGPTRKAPVMGTCAMEPPPAPTEWTSTLATLTGYCPTLVSRITDGSAWGEPGRNALFPTDGHFPEVEPDARCAERPHSDNTVVPHIVASGRDDFQFHLVSGRSCHRQIPEAD
jgi:hypothetical protein